MQDFYSFILLIKPRIFNTSVDLFLILYCYEYQKLAQVIEKANVLLKMYGIFGFLKFL